MKYNKAEVSYLQKIKFASALCLILIGRNTCGTATDLDIVRNQIKGIKKEQKTIETHLKNLKEKLENFKLTVIEETYTQHCTSTKNLLALYAEEKENLLSLMDGCLNTIKQANECDIIMWKLMFFRTREQIGEININEQCIKNNILPQTCSKCLATIRTTLKSDPDYIQQHHNINNFMLQFAEYDKKLKALKATRSSLRLPHKLRSFPSSSSSLS